MNAPDTMSPAQLRRFVVQGAETSTTARQVFNSLPYGTRDALPVGWDLRRIVALCASAVAPEGPEPALCLYDDVDDLLEDGSTHITGDAIVLGRGSMLLTEHSTVRRRPDGTVVRLRKRRTGLVVSLSGRIVEVLWSHWCFLEANA